MDWVEMRQLWIISSVIALLCMGVTGCEDEPPPMPRGGEQPQAEKTEGQKAAGANNKDQAPNAAQGPAASKSSRAPSASQIMGITQGGANSGKGQRPSYLGKERKPGQPSPLFTGRAAAPSGDYNKIKGRVLPISPIHRHWGQDRAQAALKKKAAKKEEVVTAADTEVDSDLFAGQPKSEKKTPTTPNAAEANTSKGFSLLLYRLDQKTGEVERFERKFKSQAAHDAAERFALQQGYKHKPPTRQQIMAIKGKSAPASPKAEKKEKDDKKAKAKDACAFRATWTETVGGKAKQQSRCFPSQAAVTSFMKQRREAAAKAAKAAQEKAKPKPPPSTAEKPAKDTALEPAKLE